MKKRTLLRLVAGAALVPSFGLSAHADTLDEIKKAGKIRVAIDTAIPPFGMTDDKMQPTGSDVDLARLLAKDLGVQLEIVTTTGPSRIPMLQTNKADIVVSTLSITPAWTEPPVIVAPSGDSTTSTPSDCRPRAIAAIRSDSLTRSSAAPRTTVRPAAQAAATNSAGNSSIMSGTHAVSMSMPRSGAWRTRRSATGSPPWTRA